MDKKKVSYLLSALDRRVKQMQFQLAEDEGYFAEHSLQFTLRDYVKAGRFPASLVPIFKNHPSYANPEKKDWLLDYSPTDFVYCYSPSEAKQYIKGLGPKHLEELKKFFIQLRIFWG